MKQKGFNIFKQWWFWACLVVIIVTIGLILFVALNDFDDDDDDYNKNSKSSYNKNSNDTKDKTNKYNDSSNSEEKTDVIEEKVPEKVELTESEKLVISIASLMEEKLAFDTGSYIKGDVPAGEYAFITFDGSGEYYSEEDASGDIIDNENFSSFGYVKVHEAGDLETRGVLINVKAFDQLGVKGAKEIYEILNEKPDWNQAGYYKVGVDLEPGKYIIESMGEGYYAILSGPIGNNSIVKNDIFNGKKTVTVKKGQYLKISRSTIKKA